jgi:hypothetical protein
MTAIEGESETRRRTRRMGRARLVILTAVLVFVTLCFFVSNLATRFSGSETSETSVNVKDTWPTEEDVLSYLAGETISPIKTNGLPDEGEMPLKLSKERITSLEVKREGTFFTSVRFVVQTDPGPCTVEGLINHHPSDGMNVFDSFTVLKASRR